MLVKKNKLLFKINFIYWLLNETKSRLSGWYLQVDARSSQTYSAILELTLSHGVQTTKTTELRDLQRFQNVLHTTTNAHCNVTSYFDDHIEEYKRRIPERYTNYVEWRGNQKIISYINTLRTSPYDLEQWFPKTGGSLALYICRVIVLPISSYCTTYTNRM